MKLKVYYDLVSVIIPYYNNEKTIIRALESVLNQTYKELEIIIINDGSVDNSYKIVCEYLDKIDKNIRVIHLSQKNLGPSSARNNGIKNSKGKYIAFIDADDSWKLNKIENQVNFLNKNKHIDMLGCNLNIIDKKNRVKRHYFVRKNKNITFKMMLYKHYYTSSCVIVKKDILLKVGMFEEEQSYMEDSLLFTNISRKFNTYITNEFLVNTYKYSFGENGLSADLWNMQKYELINFYKFYKLNPSEKNKLYFFEYIFISIFSILKFLRRIIVLMFRKWR